MNILSTISLKYWAVLFHYILSISDKCISSYNFLWRSKMTEIQNKDPRLYNSDLAPTPS